MRQGDSVSDRAHPAGPGAPDRDVARWIRRTLADDPPRARSLIVTVWGDALAPHGGDVWLAGLIRLLAPLGLNDRLVRTSVFRLARDGWLTGETRGRRSRYRLTPGGRARFAAAYRRIYAPPADAWDGTWEVVVDPPGAAPAERQRVRDDVRWAGFGTLAPGLFVRPLVDGVAPADEVPSRVVRLHARDAAGGARGLPLATVAPSLWDLPALAQDYRRFLALFGRVIDRFRMRAIEASDPAQCFVVRTLLIHAYRRVLLRDPRLPASLLPLDWPGSAAYVLTRDFYRLTHARAEAHLAATLSEDRAPWPPADASFHARFGGLSG